jgi:uncharacterized protein YdhG (YjbR/CyaY superfamily)
MNEVDKYIATFPEGVQQLLLQVRATITKAAPQAVETMAYGMPAYKTNGRPLIYFAAFKNHIGLYATPSGHKQFAEELSVYKQGKGSVQFPLDKALPLQLIERIVVFRAMENESKMKKNNLRKA